METVLSGRNMDSKTMCVVDEVVDWVWIFETAVFGTKREEELELSGQEFSKGIQDNSCFLFSGGSHL